MKKLLQKPFLLAVLLVVIYLLALALGVFAVTAYPFLRQKKTFVPRTQSIAREYLEGTEETLERTQGANTRIFFYDVQGNLLRYAAPPSRSQEQEPDISVEKYLPAVLSGEELCRPAFAQASLREFSDIMIVVGTPIRHSSGAVAGAVLLAKNMMDLPEALIGYTVYFTVCYWLTAYFIVSYMRKKQRLEALRQSYVDNVTHAFKTPIASIKALAETLCDGVEPDPDRQRTYYGMILQEANRQDHMVRDILELSKLQSNGMDFTKSAVNASNILKAALEKYTVLCDCREIALHVSEGLEALPPLYTNAACLKQLLDILLDNALKFVPEGGDIWLEADAARNIAIFCVRDNGVGISKEALPHVFERFYKCGHDHNESGSGLGLAIAEKIAGGLREKIWAESEPGKGSAFCFTIHLK